MFGAAVFICQIIYFVNLAAGHRRIHAQRQGELNVLTLGEIVQPGQELRNLRLRDLREQVFREVVNKHMGDIVVAGMKAMRKPLKKS